MLYLHNGTLLWLVSTHENTLQAYFLSQLILEETKLKAKDDTYPNGKSQAFAAKVKNLKKRKFGKFKPCQKKINISKIQWFECNEYGNFKRDCPKNP